MIVRWVASTAVADFIAARNDLFGEAPSRNRVRFCAATLASNFVPSVNVTSLRSVIVSTVLSALYAHSVARFGTILPVGSAFSSVSYTACP